MKYRFGFMLVLLLSSMFVQAQTNLALNKTVTVSSVETQLLLGKFAVDGNATSRWSSEFADNQWIAIDLGSTVVFDTVKLVWEDSYAKEYSLQISNDGTTWTTVYTQSNGDGATDLISIKSTARYVRVLCIRRFLSYGFSLYEIEITNSATAGSSSAKSSSSIKSSSASSLSSSTKSSSSSSSKPSGNTVSATFLWDTPTSRENGDVLLITEIGGYDIRGYDSKGVQVFTLEVKGGFLVSSIIPIAKLGGAETFTIAVYDTNGLYSKFVPIEIKERQLAKPINLRIK